MGGFADQFAELIVPTQFDLLGETWAYTPAGGEASNVVVVPGPEEVRHEDRGGKKAIRERSLLVRTSEVTVATLQDATFANAARSYSVLRVESLSEDTGVATVRVIHVAEASRSRPGLRDGPSW